MKSIKQIKKIIKNAVFPRFCIQCKKEGSLLCDECFVFWQPGKLKIIDEDRHVHSWQYADQIARQLICAWKFDFDQSAFKIIKRKLKPSLIGLQHIVHIHNIEAIVPVPLYSRRYCERGFDQAVLISEFIAEELGLPVVNLIERVRSTGHQVDREITERKDAMKNNPFKILDSVKNHNLNSALLIDDVWTTGATINAVEEVLEDAGVDRVWKYTLAKG